MSPLTRKKIIPLNQEYQPGDIIAYSGHKNEYEQMNYAQIISEAELIEHNEMPDAKTFMKGWGSEVRRTGFVCVKVYDQWNGEEIGYTIIPALTIEYRIDDITKEIEKIKETTKCNVDELQKMTNAHVMFLESLKA